MPKVYIILLNYNRPDDTIECLESVLKLAYDRYQIFVVDNSETDRSIIAFENWATGNQVSVSTKFKHLIYPLQNKPIDYSVLTENNYLEHPIAEKVVFIKSNSNDGFAAGNNIGLRYVVKHGEAGSYAWLLNNDTVVTKNALQEQINYIQENKNNIGILGSRLANYNKPDVLQAVGGRFNTKSFISHHIGENMPIDTPKEALDDIDYPVGASMLIPMDFLKNVGLLNEDYFLYFEELDWTQRAKKAGYTIDWCENAFVYHKEGKTTGTDTGKKSYFLDTVSFKSRNKFYHNYFKNKPLFYFYNLLIILNRIKRGQFKRAAAFFEISFLNNSK